MIIKKGTIVKVNSQRKGTFTAIASSDFDTEKEEFYPLKVAKGNGTVEGYRTVWEEGESIPCRNTLCTISVIQEPHQ